jgi:hypothetical protein
MHVELMTVGTGVKIEVTVSSVPYGPERHQVSYKYPCPRMEGDCLFLSSWQTECPSGHRTGG